MKHVTVFVLLAISLTSYGQWTPSSPVVYLNSGLTKVGIGTSTPSNPLQLEGTSPDGEYSILVKNTSGARTYLTSFPTKSSIQTDQDFTIRTNGTGWNDMLTVTNAGNVGIGVYPTNKLEVNGTTYISGKLGVGVSTPVNPIQIEGNTTELNLLVKNNITNGARVYLSAFADKGSIQTDKDFTIRNNSSGWHDVFVVKYNGSVGIGTMTTNGYKLAVEGTIGAREVNVNTSTWSDYVFYDDYKLPSLETVERYVKQHHHLPEIPSAQEVEEKGVNVGEMNALLLKKIEELTLYVIELKKENIEQSKEISSLKSRK